MKTFSLIAFVLWTLSINANQRNDLTFQSLNSNSGLSSDNITDIMQDGEGFIWITSRDGINRFDGYNVINYTPEFTPGNSFNTAHFVCVEEDKDQNIWFGSYNSGVNIYNKSTGDVEIIRKEGPVHRRILDDHIHDIFCDSRGRVWIATSRGLNRFDPETGEMNIYSQESSPGKTNPEGIISNVFENSKGDIIVSSWGRGIYVYSEDLEDFTQTLFKPNALIDDPVNRIWNIFEDSKGTYWIGTWDAGLYHAKMNNDHSFEILKIIDQSYTSDDLQTLSSPIIYTIYEDHGGEIWVGTPYGLNIISDSHSLRPGIRTFRAGDEESSVAHNDIVKIYEDKSGIVWLATGGGGINFIDPSINRFTTFSLPVIDKYKASQTIRSFISFKDSLLLLGANGIGFGQYDTENQEFIPYRQIEAFKNVPDNLNAVVYFLVDHQERLWIGTRYWGVFVVDLETHTCQNYLQEGLPIGDGRRHINAIFEDRFHHIWIGNETGLYQFIPEEDGVNYMINVYTADDSDINSLSGSHVNTIYEDSEGYIWIGTVGKGLDRFYNDGKGSEITFQHFRYAPEKEGSIQCNFINSVYEDRNHRLWIGTGTAGLALFDRSNLTFQHIREQNGMSSNNVLDIIEHGNDLWLTTKKGLTKLRWQGLSNSQFETYNYVDGLQGNVFIKGAAYKDKGGNIFVGGYYGFNVFTPDELSANTYIPRVVITDVNIGAENHNPYKLLKEDISVSHKDNDISIEFSALSYFQPQKNKYSYVLDGFEERWHTVNADRRIARYTNLPSGRYTFNVVASNNSGIWNNEPLSFSFRIKNHPAKTWWAVLGYILAFLSITAFIFFSQLRSIKMKQAFALEKIERKKEENVNQFKFRFFTNISHELLTPLSVIYTSIENLMSKNEITRENIEVVHRNTSRLMHLLSQLIDFRKVESSTMKLSVSRGDMNLFIRKITENLQPLAEKRSVSIELNGESENAVYFDHDKLDKVISNLLTNALRFTPAKGKIFINYSCIKEEDTDWLSIEVIDSGNGIPDDRLTNIFERFYQVESVTGRTFGAGIGLALSKNLTELHKGSIKVDNDDEFGAKFTVTIPVNKETYLPEEILEGELQYQSRNYMIEPPPPEPVLGEEPIREIRETGDKNKILIVEDNNDFRKLLRNHFANYFVTLDADNGEEGFRLCLEHQPSVVITDMMMPGLNGVDLCRKIKDTFETSHIMVIMLTAKTSEDARIESYRADANSYITKPVDFRTLQTRVNSLLKQRHLLIEKYNSGIMPKPKNGEVSTLDQEFLKKIQDFIESKLSNSELNVMTLNRELGTSNSMLYRKITRLTGMSPVEFIRYIRLQNAAKMLLNEGLNVSESAYSTGFNDLSYFSKSFKKQFGISPKQYSKKVRLN